MNGSDGPLFGLCAIIADHVRAKASSESLGTLAQAWAFIRLAVSSHQVPGDLLFPEVSKQQAVRPQTTAYFARFGPIPILCISDLKGKGKLFLTSLATNPCVTEI